MTVAEIKEYIDEQEKYARQQIENHEIKIDLKDHINILDNVRSMLDELEPNKQIMWERDMAIKQLEGLGYKFCGKEREQ